MAVVLAVAHCVAFTDFKTLYSESDTVVGFDLCSANKNRVRCSSWCLRKGAVFGFKSDRLNGQTCCCARRSRNGKASSQKDQNSGTEICIFESTSSIGTKCQMDSDCTGMMVLCHKKKCLCVPGYHYNPSGRNCVRRCSEYGNTMTPYPGLGIKGRNLDKDEVDIQRGFSLFSYCARRCVRITKFKCISVDVQPGWCHFGNVGYLDVPKALRETGLGRKWNLLMRDCA